MWHQDQGRRGQGEKMAVGGKERFVCPRNPNRMTVIPPLYSICVAAVSLDALACVVQTSVTGGGWNGKLNEMRETFRDSLSVNRQVAPFHDTLCCPVAMRPTAGGTEASLPEAPPGEPDGDG